MSITALFILGKIGNNSNTHQHENKNYNVMLVINRINDWSTWMNFKDMMLSKRSQTQKNIYDVYFHESVRNRQSSSVSVKIRTVRVVTDWKGVKENFRVMWIYYILTESSRKTSIFALLTMPKPLIVWITRNCGKFWKRWKYQTTWPASWEICMQVRKQQLELDMEQQTGSK